MKRTLQNTGKILLILLLALSLFVGCQTPAKTEPATGNADGGAATEATAGTDGASGAINLEAVNKFLNESAALGEGSKANPVAIIPINHIDGPGNEDNFYAFVNFKYVARDFIKYQITYISCTCREASVNFWQTAYVEMSLPESGKLEDAVIKTLSFDKDSSGKYLGGFWGDSDPIPNGTTYEQLKTEYIPYFVGKTYGQIGGLSVMKDIDLADYQKGDGRANYTIDAFSGASVSTNNMIRMLLAIGQFHGTDPFFSGDTSAADASPAAPVEATEATTTAEATTEAVAAPAPAALGALPAPVDTTKSFKATKDATEDTPCDATSYSADCSAVNNTNLSQYLNRSDVLYIDTRDYEDYVKKHIRNFEVIPFFAYIYDAEAANNPDLIQLYGGTTKEPIPVYEESDKLLEVFFPKDKTLFIMCQSGGRVKMLMEIMEARGWDMSKVYNIGGMAQYTAAEYRDLITDTPELIVESKYSFEGLTRIAP